MIDPTDIIGEKFGKLLVVNYGGKNKKYTYFCKCDCGKTKKISRDNLKRAKSCGCVRGRRQGKNIIGQEVGLLKVVSEDVSRKMSGIKRRFYFCECKCGKVVSINRNNLVSGHTKSCGCLSHLKGKENKGWLGYNDISGTAWRRIKERACIRDLDFTITIEDAWDQYQKQNGRCALTGWSISTKAPKGCYGTASLDRIDSNLGYTSDNIQWVHKDINRIKNDYPENRFIEMCKAIVEHHERKNDYTKR